MTYEWFLSLKSKYLWPEQEEHLQLLKSRLNHDTLQLKLKDSTFRFTHLLTSFMWVIFICDRAIVSYWFCFRRSH